MMKNIGNTTLVFLGMWYSVVLLEDADVSKLTVSVSKNNRQYFLDVTMMIESAFFRDATPSKHTANHTIPFSANFPCYFFSTSPICFLPINGPYTIIFTVIDVVKVKHSSSEKKILILFSVQNFFLVHLVNFFH